jgi:PAS domain S-box-containing protein
MELHQNSQADGPISFVMDYLVREKIPVSYTEKFIFGFKDIIAPYLQKEFSERYYAYFTAQKLIDEALRRIWAKAMDRYYHFTIGAIGESAKQYRTLLENLPQKIFLKDRNFVYISCNENYAKDLKIRPEQIKGRTDYEFYPKNLAEKYRDDDRKVMKAGKIKDIEEEYIRDGKKMFVHTVKTPVKDSNGSVVGILGIFWDITETKRIENALRENEKKFRSIFENAGDGILVADLEKKKFLMANRKICKMLGYSREELLKLDVSRIHPKKDLPTVIRAFKLQAQKKITVTRGLPVLRKNRTVFYADVSSGPFVLKGKRYLMGFFRDATERLDTEKNLERMARKLAEKS